MKKLRLFVYIFIGAIVLTSCSGMKTLTIQTHEAAQVTLPKDIRKLLIVDNAVSQSSDVGHTEKRMGRSTSNKATVITDSLPIIFTEALAQFLDEEEFFDVVMLHDKPLRSDREYWKEEPLTPEQMLQLKNETGADAIVSLDKLLVTSNWTDNFIQEGYPYATLRGKIATTMRVYLPTLEGRIPTVQFTDSLEWQGFDISDGRAYAEFVIPHAENALKDHTVYAADKMTYVLTPHWITQERWYYTLSSSMARDAESFAEQTKWAEAIAKWENFYNLSKKKIDKAKVASNIALGYEMLDDLQTAHTWITTAQQLFNESTITESLERKRATVYKTEIERRLDISNKLNMQVD